MGGCRDPGPTPEETEEYERLCSQQESVTIDGGALRAPANLPTRSPALLWVRGREVIRPPARAFEVLARTGRGAQESHPVFERLALPPLRCPSRPKGRRFCFHAKGEADSVTRDRAVARHALAFVTSLQRSLLGERGGAPTVTGVRVMTTRRRTRAHRFARSALANSRE